MKYISETEKKNLEIYISLNKLSKHNYSRCLLSFGTSYTIEDAENFADDFLNVLHKHDYINELHIRDYQIKKEYKRLRAGGMLSEKARELLSEKYFLSDKAIQYVIYPPKSS